MLKYHLKIRNLAIYKPFYQATMLCKALLCKTLLCKALLCKTLFVTNGDQQKKLVVNL